MPEIKIPPTDAIPTPLRNSEPIPLLNANGSIPKTAAKVIIKIGLNLSHDAVIIAL